VTTEKSKQTARIPEEKRATEYLANERTFLAWIRTSIAVISFGFIVAKVTPHLIEHADASTPIGIAMMCFGALLSVLAMWRYHVVNRAIDEGEVSADRGLVVLVTVLIVLLAGAMVVYFLVSESKSTGDKSFMKGAGRSLIEDNPDDAELTARAS
jgi:putative membrane protein